MDTVTVPFGDDRAKTAQELIALAGDDPTQVRTSGDGFVVPREIADRYSGSGGDDGYDPGKYSVEQVSDYLEDADDAERSRVQRAEAQGKNRKTIADWQPAGGADDSEGA